MAAVVPLAEPAPMPMAVDTASEEDAAAAAAAAVASPPETPLNNNDDEVQPMMSDHEHDRDEDADADADDDELDGEEEAAPKEWDEGGKSHCGYSDSVHETLMSIGQSIHRVVGEPSEGVQGAMRGIGSWFQEASYAARDLKMGKMNMTEETAAAMKSVVSGDEEEKEEDGEGGNDNDNDNDGDNDGDGDEGEGERGSAEDGEQEREKLEPVKEDAPSVVTEVSGQF